VYQPFPFRFIPSVAEANSTHCNHPSCPRSFFS
jgi:hypothetical protein